MKNIIFLSIILLNLAETAHAQLAGKRFISGSAGINFSNQNPSQATSSNNYGYNFNINLGKFKTDTRVSGWTLSNSLGGKKDKYYTYNNGGSISNDRSGINNVGFGLGKFWHFYKHFNDKIGIFGGPTITLGYLHTKDFSTSGNGQTLMEKKTNKISVSFGLNAGLYYKLSEKWWLTGSLAFSDPFNVGYSFINSKSENQSYSGKAKQLTYAFSPVFTFPSVGLGLNYFYGR